MKIEMKILKYFFYTLLVLFLLFVANGLLNSEIEYGAEILVDETREKCWEVFTDPCKRTAWRSNITFMEAVIESPDIIGNKYLVRIIDAGQEYEMTETVTVYEPVSHYAFERESEVLVNNIEFTFEVAGEDATKITTKNTLEGKDVLMKSIFPFMKGLFIRQIESELMELKNVIED